MFIVGDVPRKGQTCLKSIFVQNLSLAVALYQAIRQVKRITKPFALVPFDSNQAISSKIFTCPLALLLLKDDRVTILRPVRIEGSGLVNRGISPSHVQIQSALDPLDPTCSSNLGSLRLASLHN